MSPSTSFAEWAYWKHVFFFWGQTERYDEKFWTAFYQKT